MFLFARVPLHCEVRGFYRWIVEVREVMFTWEFIHPGNGCFVDQYNVGL